MDSLKDFKGIEVERGFSNKGGTIKAVGKVHFLSPTINIGGDIIAETLFYRHYNPSSEKEYEFMNIANLICNNAIYDFGVGNITVRSLLELYAATTFIVARFYNESVIKAGAPLTIKAQEILNGYEHNLISKIKQFNGYNLANHEWEFKSDPNLFGTVDKNNILYIRPETYNCAAAILGDDLLDFQAGKLFYNSATIESRKNIKLKGSKIQTGWATWSEKTICLPFVEGAQYRGYRCHDGVFEFPYDFYSPQKSLIRAYGYMEISDCNKFISSFGNIQVSGAFRANTNGLFLNYAGNIRISSGAEIRVERFVNTIGTMATSEAGLKYWKRCCYNRSCKYHLFWSIEHIC